MIKLNKIRRKLTTEYESWVYGIWYMLHAKAEIQLRGKAPAVRASGGRRWLQGQKPCLIPTFTPPVQSTYRRRARLPGNWRALQRYRVTPIPGRVKGGWHFLDAASLRRRVVGWMGWGLVREVGIRVHRMQRGQLRNTAAASIGTTGPGTGGRRSGTAVSAAAP